MGYRMRSAPEGPVTSDGSLAEDDAEPRGDNGNGASEDPDPADDGKAYGKLGGMSLGKLMYRLSLPGILGMFVQSTYNLVDTIFVGRIGEGTEEGVKAITALAAAFPLQLVLIAIGVGTGVGVASLISRLLGKGEREKAVTVANNAIFLSVIFWLITGVVGYLFAPRILGLFLDETDIIAMGSEYLRIIMVFSGTIFLFIIAERILQAQGNTLTPMVVLAGTAVLNIALDPIFIFGFWIVPPLGVKGAAIATVIARSLGTAVMIAILLSKKNELPLKIRRFMPDWELIWKTYVVGGPTMLIQLLGSVMLAVVNVILGNISSYMIAVLGLFFKTQSFIMMPIFGLVHGFLPVVGYNYGAGNYKRVRKALKLALIWSLVISGVGFVLFQALPGTIISIFNSDITLVSYGEKAFRRIAVLFFLSGPIVIMASFFQGLGKGGKSLFILLIRRVIVLLPAVYLLSVFASPIHIWLAYPISTVWAFTVGTLLVVREMRSLGTY